MIKCPECKEKIPDSHSSCPKCSQKLPNLSSDSLSGSLDTRASSRFFKRERKDGIIVPPPKSTPRALYIISTYEILCGVPYLIVSIFLIVFFINIFNSSATQEFNLGYGISVTTEELFGTFLVFIPILLFFSVGSLLSGIFLLMKHEWARKSAAFYAILSMFFLPLADFLIMVLPAFIINIVPYFIFVIINMIPGALCLKYLLKSETVDMFLAIEHSRYRKRYQYSN